jgi:hypothetical protein
MIHVYKINNPIEEKNAFLSSVIAVETAVPAMVILKKLNGMESPYRINQHVLPRLLNIQNVSVVHFMLFFFN